MIIKKPTPTESDYKESISLSNINKTIIREAELDILILENDLSRIYNESGSSSKKRKCNINICGYNSFVFIA